MCKYRSWSTSFTRVSDTEPVLNWGSSYPLPGWHPDDVNFLLCWLLSLTDHTVKNFRLIYFPAAHAFFLPVPHQRNSSHAVHVAFLQSVAHLKIQLQIPFLKPPLICLSKVNMQHLVQSAMAEEYSVCISAQILTPGVNVLKITWRWGSSSVTFGYIECPSLLLLTEVL